MRHVPNGLKGSSYRTKTWKRCKRCNGPGKSMTIVKDFCDQCYFQDDSLQTTCAF